VPEEALQVLREQQKMLVAQEELLLAEQIERVLVVVALVEKMEQEKREVQHQEHQQAERGVVEQEHQELLVEQQLQILTVQLVVMVQRELVEVLEVLQRPRQVAEQMVVEVVEETVTKAAQLLHIIMVAQEVRT
jgi:hypothetical protein